MQYNLEINKKYYDLIKNAKVGRIKKTKDFYCIYYLYDEDNEKYVTFVGKAIFGIRKYYNKDEFVIPLKNSTYRKKKYLGEENIVARIFFSLNDIFKLKMFENLADAKEYLSEHPKKEDYVL